MVLQSSSFPDCYKVRSILVPFPLKEPVLRAEYMERARDPIFI